MKSRTIDEVRKVLSEISQAPSGIDTGWEFEAEEIDDGFKIRTSFKRPDTKTGIWGTGFGRWNLTPKDSSDDAIVKTAYVAVKLVVEHELMESFLYQGHRIFDPHKTLAELAFPGELKN